MRIIQEFMQAINQIRIGEIAMITRRSPTGNVNHFKIKMITRESFEITIFNGDFKIIDDIRFYTISGVISLLLDGLLKDGQGNIFSPVVKMENINGKIAQVDNSFLCLN